MVEVEWTDVTTVKIVITTEMAPVVVVIVHMIHSSDVALNLMDPVAVVEDIVVTTDIDP